MVIYFIAFLKIVTVLRFIGAGLLLQFAEMFYSNCNNRGYTHIFCVGYSMARRVSLVPSHLSQIPKIEYCTMQLWRHC